MNHNCAVCTTLWQEYANATHAHIAIEAKLEVAQLQHDQEAMQRLLVEAQRASDRRTQCRIRVAEHEQNTHALAAKQG